MKRIKKAMLISSIVTLFIFGLLWTSAGVYAEKKADEVTFNFSWTPQGRIAPFYTAKAKGYYAENGIEVNIVRGYGPIRTAQAVDQGKADFGTADMGSVVIVIAQGGKIKAVSIIEDISPQGFDALKPAGVTRPKDMEGKKLAAAIGGGTRELLPVFFKQNNIDASKVNVVTLEGALYVSALLRGDVDIIAAWRGSTHEALVNEAKKKGLEVSRINISDYGVDIYGAALITREKTIKENPDLVKRFVRATYKGMRYGIEHPEEAVDIIMKLHPELVRDIISAQWQSAIEMSQTPTQKKMGYGFIDEEKMKRTRDIVLDGYNIKEDVPLAQLYTNEFFPGKQ